MLKLTSGLLAIVLASTAATAQQSFTADQLVAKNLEARGGAAALAAIKSLQMEGRMLTPGDFELKMKEVRVRQPNGDAIRDDLTVQGLTIVQAYDGRSGWKINPFQGRRDAEKMSADEVRAMSGPGLDQRPLALRRCRQEPRDGRRLLRISTAPRPTSSRSSRPTATNMIICSIPTPFSRSR